MASDIHKDLSKGIDRKSTRNNIPRGKSELTENLKPHSTGKLETRRGVRSHAGVLPTGTTKPVRGTAVYRSELEEYPVAIADGKVHNRTTIGASTFVSLEADITADFSIGPAFHVDTIDPTSARRLSGGITGTNVEGNKAVITDITYNYGSNLATLTISVLNRVFINSATAVNDVINNTTDDTVADWVTITQAGYSEYNGTFKIVSVSEVFTTPHSVITMVVENSAGDETTPNESDCGAFAEIATDVHSVAAINTLLATDTISGHYNDTTSTLTEFTNTVSIREINGTTVAFNMSEDEFADDLGVPGDIHLHGQRTSDEIPVVSGTGFDVGNITTIGSFNRGFKIQAATATTVTVEESIVFLNGQAVEELYAWTEVAVPGGDGDLVPANPTRILPEAPTARVRTASMQDSIYMTNGTDNIQKYDGTNVYRMGLPNWNLEHTLYVDTNKPGIVLTEYTYISISTTVDEREITLATGDAPSIGDVLVHKETGARFTVKSVDTDTSATVTTVVVGNNENNLPKDLITFDGSSEILGAADIIIATDHGWQENTAVLYEENAANTLSNLTDSTVYYVNVWDKDHIRLKATPTSASVQDLTANGTPTTAGHTLTPTYDKTFYLETTYSYYYRLNLIDVNSNLIGSKVTGWGDTVIDMKRSGAITHCLTLPPALDNYDFDRMEVEVYRTKARATAPFYRIRTAPIPFNAIDNIITIHDTTPDLSLGEGDLDSVMSATKGAELLTSGNSSLTSQYIATASNKLVLGNVKSTDILDVAFSKKTSDTSVYPLHDTQVAISNGTDTVTLKFVDTLLEHWGATIAGGATEQSSSGDLEIRVDLSGVYPSTGLTSLSMLQEGYKFTANAGTSALTVGQEYFIRNIITTPATIDANQYIAFNVSETVTGNLVPYVGAATAYSLQFIGTSASTSVGSTLYTGDRFSPFNTRPFTTTSNDSGNIKLSLVYTSSFVEGERVKFSTAAGGVLPSTLSPDVIYTVYNVVSAGANFKDPDGNVILYAATTGTCYIQHLEGFFIDQSTTGLITADQYITLHSPYKSIQLNNTPGSVFRDAGQTAVNDAAGVFSGVWKCSARNSILCRFNGKHEATTPVFQGDAYTYWTAIGSSNTIIVPSDANFFDEDRYHQQTNRYNVSDIFKSLQMMGRAFNRYMTYQSSPWAMCEFGSTLGTDSVRFLGATMSDEITVTITEGDTNLVTSYVNEVNQLTGTGQKRLFPSRIVLSYENFPEIFDDPFASDSTRSDSIVDLNPADGQTLTGLATFFTEASTGAAQVDDTVVVFKQNSIFAVNVRTREIRQIASGGIGCTVPDSIATTPTGIMFANNEGIHRVTRALTVDHIGEDLEGIWRDIDKDNLANAVAIVDPHDRLYKLCIPSTVGDTTNTRMLIYDYTREGKGQQFGAWGVFLLSGISTMAISSTDLFMGTEAGDVWQVRRDNDSDLGDYQDADAEAIPEKLLYGSQDFGDSSLKKKVRRITAEFDMDQSDLTDVLLETSINSEDTFRSSGTATMTRSNTSSLPQQQNPSVSWTPEAGKCHRMQVQITHSTRKEKLIISGLIFSVKALSEQGQRTNTDSEST